MTGEKEKNMQGHMLLWCSTFFASSEKDLRELFGTYHPSFSFSFSGRSQQ